MADAQQTILVVEDEPLLRSDLCERIDRLGWRALPAASGFEALSLLRRERPSLAVVDVVMQGMDGFKLAGTIKEDRETFTPVLLVTALSDEASRRRGHAAGADDFLVKPVSTFELELRIKAMLRIKELTEQVQAANRRLTELATTDGLTGLSNRRRFDELLTYEAARSARYGHTFTLLLLDIDHFKRVNDLYGHVVGDHVLRHVAARLKATVRTTDHLARYGGEELAVIAVGTDAANSRIFGERLRRAIGDRAIQLEDGRSIGVTVSIGGATSTPESAPAPLVLIERADAALYSAKRAGRDRVALSPVAALDASLANAS